MRMARILLVMFGLLVSLVPAGTAAGLGHTRTEFPWETEPEQLTVTPADWVKSAVGAENPPLERRSFTVAATGDLLIHSPIVRRARTADGWDFSPMFAQVAPILRAADLAICHVETPLSPDNQRLSTFPLFSVPNQLADAIAHAGYDTCSLASNHSLDSGLRGVSGTIEALDRVGVAHTGMARSPSERNRLNLLDVNGATLAHLSYTYGLNTGPLRREEAHLANIIDEESILDEAGQARAVGADFVILSLHWGTEYTLMPDRYQTDLGARLLSSPHIDLIIGHHAHVVQPVDRIGDEYIAYGLGNFLSYMSPLPDGTRRGTQDGTILLLTVVEDPGSGRWRVTLISHTPTRVDLATAEVINALDPKGNHNPAVLARSAAETSEALAALGTRVRPLPELAFDKAEWLFHLLG